MSASSFGSRFVITTFGESHGVGLGVVIDGCPAGVEFDHELLERELARRRPGKHGQSKSVVSDREESDAPEVLSGVFEGKTIGTPIAIMVRNKDQRSKDYEQIKAVARPGHADDMWKQKFGHSDHRGGGRSSGRETVARVMAGAVAQMVVRAISPDTRVVGFSTQIGPTLLSESEQAKVIQKLVESDLDVDSFAARFPNSKKAVEIEEMLLNAKLDGKSFGGMAQVMVFGSPRYLGQPVFHKLKADLASAYLGIGATSSVELGDGLDVIDKEGSEFHRKAKAAAYGGIRGGISTGEDLIFRVSFKPTSSVLDVAKKGRHDPCIVPRAIPVMEAMTWIVLADHLLWQRTDQIKSITPTGGDGQQSFFDEVPSSTKKKATSKKTAKLESESNWPEEVLVYTDGACRGNPGPSSIGLHFEAHDGSSLLDIGEVIGDQTNNVAEYSALERALAIAHENGAHRLTVRSDSELMVKQLKGEYKVKAPQLQEIFERCMEWKKKFKHVKFEHVRREFNKVADRLANQALDGDF